MGDAKKKSNATSHQHYVPAFYLRRFASDAKCLKILAMTRRHLHIVEEERSIEYTCAMTRIYRYREDEITRLESLVQRSATWTLSVAGIRGLLSPDDARDLFRAVNHFSVRTPLSRGFLERMSAQGLDLSKLGSDLDNVFENMSVAYEAWDKFFHLASVRILHADTDLLTSSFPTSSFEERLAVDGVTFPYHVTMAIDRRILVHIMIRGFDLDERVKQQFWIAPADDEIVLRHNLSQVGRFIHSGDVEYLVHTGASSKSLIDRCLFVSGWTSTVRSHGRRVFTKAS